MNIKSIRNQLVQPHVGVVEGKWDWLLTFILYSSKKMLYLVFLEGLTASRVGDGIRARECLSVCLSFFSIRNQLL